MASEAQGPASLWVGELGALETGSVSPSGDAADAQARIGRMLGRWSLLATLTKHHTGAFQCGFDDFCAAALVKPIYERLASLGR